MNSFESERMNYINCNLCGKIMGFTVVGDGRIYECENCHNAPYEKGERIFPVARTKCNRFIGDILYTYFYIREKRELKIDNKGHRIYELKGYWALNNDFQTLFFYKDLSVLLDDCFEELRKSKDFEFLPIN